MENIRELMCLYFVSPKQLLSFYEIKIHQWIEIDFIFEG